MLTLYVANFDFDDRLAGGGRARAFAPNARFLPVLERLCEPGDAATTIGPFYGIDRFDRVELWGVDEHVEWWLRTFDPPPGGLDRLPDPAVVRAVNGRRWQFAAEGELGVRPAGMTLCASPAELAAAVVGLPGDWVLKSEHGGSGRGVRFGRGPLPGALRNWAAKRFRAGLCVTCEPRARFDAEFSAHFTLTPDAAAFAGVCRLRSTRGGQFERVEPTRLTPPLAGALPVWEAVAERARAAGYRGPLGIDAGSAGGRVVRPVMDINARWTMGRVALETGRAVENPS